MHLADLQSYLDADRRLLAMYTDPDACGAQGYPECGRLGKILQRPYHRRVRDMYLERRALPDVVSGRAAELGSPDSGLPLMAPVLNIEPRRLRQVLPLRTNPEENGASR